jgi:excisionase family DNA binding protein
MSDPLVLTVPEAAELLGISADLGYDLARRGRLPGALQLGRRWVVSRPRLLAALGAENGLTEETS